MGLLSISCFLWLGDVDTTKTNVVGKIEDSDRCEDKQREMVVTVHTASLSCRNGVTIGNVQYNAGRWDVTVTIAEEVFRRVHVVHGV